MLGQVMPVQLVAFQDAAVHGVGGFRALGGVLGDVGGHGLFGDLSGAEGADGPDVDLLAPLEDAAPDVAGGGERDAGAAGGGADGGVQERDGGPGGGGESGPVGPSMRITAWKWTAPRRWYSATLPNESFACSLNSYW
ncbi:hypothetical protein GCM10025734_49890 [Kitasatospora paranensis]